MVKNYLITGGAGFIGSNFTADCIKQGNNVVVLDLLTYAGHKENILWIQPQDNIKFVKGDIADHKKVEAILSKYSIDYIVNFAAESHVDNSINEPNVFINTNIIGTYSLLNCALQYYKNLPTTKMEQFRFLQISTDEVYGTLGKTGKFSEQSPMRPNSPYSASKAAGDHLVRAWYETYGLPTITTNCSNNYGPRQYPEKLIPRMIRCALNHQPLPVYGDGQNVRDWIHVTDHCQGIQLALEHGKIGETYCFGGNAEKTNIELVTKICELLDHLKPLQGNRRYSSLIKFVTDRPGHDKRYAIDDSKATRELGFKRTYNFENGLLATVKWYLANEEWCNIVTQNNLR